MKKEMKDKLKKIKLLILDVDGILTNGEIIVDDKGTEMKIFDVQDGFGVVLLLRAGLECSIITARFSKAVEYRAKDLGIKKIYQNARPKTKPYEMLLKDLNLKESEVCFMGDDLADLAVLKRVGLAITVPNAVKEIKECADYITDNEGGNGAVREVAEMILKAQSKWKSIVDAAS